MQIHVHLFGGWRVTVDKFLSDRVIGKIREYNWKSQLNAGKKGFQPIEISDEGLELIEYLSLDCTAAADEWHSDSEIKIDKLGYVIRPASKSPCASRSATSAGMKLFGRYKVESIHGKRVTQ